MVIFDMLNLLFAVKDISIGSINVRIFWVKRKLGADIEAGDWLGRLTCGPRGGGHKPSVLAVLYDKLLEIYCKLN